MTGPTEIAAAYAQSAPAWREGPARLYARLAAALLSAASDLRGVRVLDAGAGTGVAGAEAIRRGAACVVALDLAPEMLSSLSPTPGVAADLLALPFRDGAFDLAVSAFSLGHVAHPERAAVELRRVAPRLLASAFTVGWSHPAKVVVDAVLAERGHHPPDWYRAFKDGPEARVGDPAELSAVAAAAGFATVRVTRVDVDGGAWSAAQLVAWRLGMAHVAPFVATLTPQVRAALRHEAECALGDAPAVVVPMLVLSAS